MKLETHGSLLLASGDLLIADYSPGDSLVGSVSLRSENQVTFDSIETTIRIDPWYGDAFEVFDWIEGRAVVLCGAVRLVVLRLRDLEETASMPLDYEECDTIAAPWFLANSETTLLYVATEFRVWCIDSHLSVKWSWDAREVTIGAQIERPELVGQTINVSLLTPKGPMQMSLSAVDGSVQKEPSP